ncbi:hypothetical protein [Paracoccus onubensis]|uniref:Uncharacterized protein n=1 Tax=Paracoccus onubensis TaxID=1675788 RepID=A0A418SRR0_9RHOB|nr:hypothetical protein [Paracoccus onubensis]RJE83651.1 hypothetical protein D3P04_14660 [Paracoccus onubensis]
MSEQQPSILDAQDALSAAHSAAELIFMSADFFDSQNGNALAYGAGRIQEEIRRANEILDGLKGGAA